MLSELPDSQDESPPAGASRWAVPVRWISTLRERAGHKLSRLRLRAVHALQAVPERATWPTFVALAGGGFVVMGESMYVAVVLWLVAAGMAGIGWARSYSDPVKDLEVFIEDGQRFMEAYPPNGRHPVPPPGWTEFTERVESYLRERLGEEYVSRFRDPRLGQKPEWDRVRAGYRSRQRAFFHEIVARYDALREIRNGLL